MIKTYISTPAASIGKRVFLFGLKNENIDRSFRRITTETGTNTKSTTFIADLTKYVGLNISSVAAMAIQQSSRAIMYGNAARIFRAAPSFSKKFFI